MQQYQVPKIKLSQRKNSEITIKEEPEAISKTIQVENKQLLILNSNVVTLYSYGRISITRIMLNKQNPTRDSLRYFSEILSRNAININEPKIIYKIKK